MMLSKFNKVVIGLFIILGLGGILWGLSYLSSSPKGNLSESDSALLSTKSAATNSLAQTLQATTKEANPQRRKELYAAAFDYEVQSLQRGLSDSPEVVEKNLQILAEQLDYEQVSDFRKLIFDENADGDSRTIAVEILIRSSLPESQIFLKDFAMTSVKTQDLHQITQEKALRGRAVEGLRSTSLTREVAKQGQDEFARDRAHRQTLYLEQKAKSPEEQDLEALKQIVN